MKTTVLVGTAADESHAYAFRNFNDASDSVIVRFRILIDPSVIVIISVNPDTASDGLNVEVSPTGADIEQVFPLGDGSTDYQDNGLNAFPLAGIWSSVEMNVSLVKPDPVIRVKVDDPHSAPTAFWPSHLFMYASAPGEVEPSHPLAPAIPRNQPQLLGTRLASPRHMIALRRTAVLGVVFCCVGCGTDERTQESLLALWVTNGACPGSSEAKPALAEVWPGTRIDGMHCNLEEFVSVDEPIAAPGESCCFPVACNQELSPAENEALYRATCVGLSCDHVSDDYKSSRADAEKAVDATKLDCALESAATGPVDTPSVRCSYRVTANYSCSTAPG